MNTWINLRGISWTIGSPPLKDFNYSDLFNSVQYPHPFQREREQNEKNIRVREIKGKEPIEEAKIKSRLTLKIRSESNMRI